MRQLLAIAQITIVLGLVPGLVTSTSADPLSCDFSKEQSATVTTRITNLDIEGAELEFPQDYLFSRSFKSGAERGGLLLRADAKDFSSYPKSKAYLPNGRSKASVGIRDSVRILIASHLSLSAILNNTLSSKYKAFSYINTGSTPVNSKQTHYDLLEPSGYVADGFLKDDIFFQKDGNAVTDIIVCSTKGRVPSPGCRHIFEVGAYDIKISYGRSELPRWRELREGAAKLLHCFTIKEPIQLPEILP